MRFSPIPLLWRGCRPQAAGWFTPIAQLESFFYILRIEPFCAILDYMTDITKLYTAADGIIACDYADA